MKVYYCAQGTDEWHACRRGIATASVFSAVLATIKSGEAAERRNLRARLVVERLTNRCLPTFSTQAMNAGVEREPFARGAYEIRTGNVVQEVGFYRHDTIECGGSPDGVIETKGGLEIKCPQHAAHLEYIHLDREPPAYTAQIQGCMWLTEREWWDFVSFNPDFPPNLQLVVRRVYRDEKYIKGLSLAVELFMGEVREEYERVLKRAEQMEAETEVA